MSDHTKTIVEQVLGYGAAIISTLAAVPQLRQVWITKKADDISYMFLVVLNTSMVMWLIYGILGNNMPIIVSNVVNLALWGTITGLKYTYRSKPPIIVDLEIAPLRTDVNVS